VPMAGIIKGEFTKESHPYYGWGSFILYGIFNFRLNRGIKQI